MVTRLIIQCPTGTTKVQIYLYRWIMAGKPTATANVVTRKKADGQEETVAEFNRVPADIYFISTSVRPSRWVDMVEVRPNLTTYVDWTRKPSMHIALPN